ncbi:hypothetical protein NDU88_003438 [Pleurodeles waltl]|uniref:Uncharacterized protein n=1 Tax=Pleurodeles waltl TaxID=8319 RepID=A0AAV7W3J0_PLEWA|nr:hypothetical protein NDU88_003438 [Pleurodeles waltl]
MGGYVTGRTLTSDRDASEGFSIKCPRGPSERYSASQDTDHFRDRDLTVHTTLEEKEIREDAALSTQQAGSATKKALEGNTMRDQKSTGRTSREVRRRRGVTEGAYKESGSTPVKEHSKAAQPHSRRSVAPQESPDDSPMGSFRVNQKEDPTLKNVQEQVVPETQEKADPRVGPRRKQRIPHKVPQGHFREILRIAGHGAFSDRDLMVRTTLEEKEIGRYVVLSPQQTGSATKKAQEGNTMRDQKSTG